MIFGFVKKSIKARILFHFALFGIIFAAVISILLIGTATFSIKQYVADKNLMTAELKGKQIENEIDMIIRTTRTFFTTRKGLLPEEVKWNVRYLLHKYPYFSNIEIIDRKGTTLLKKFKYEYKRDLFAEEHGLRPSLDEIKEKRLAYSDIFFDKETLMPHISIGMVIEKFPGEPLYFIVTDINLRSVWHKFSNVDVGHGGYITLVDSKGKIIYDRNTQLVMSRSTFSGFDRVSTLLKSGEKRAELLDKNGRAILTNFYRLPKLNWTVIVSQPLREAYRPIHKLAFLMFLIVAGITIISFFGIYFMAGSISRPIKFLTDRIGGMQIEQIEESIPVQTEDEIGGLTRAFNDMIANLKTKTLALQNSEKRFRDLFELAPEGICITSFEGEIISFNENFQKIFKYPAVELKKMNIKDLYFDPEKDRPVLIEELKRNDLKNYELLLIDAMKDKLHASLSLTLIEYEDRECIETIMRDVTEEKRREREILYLKSYLGNIIESMPSMLIAIDADGRVTQWNQAAVETVGVDAAETCGQKLWDIVPYFGKYVNEIEEIIKTRTPKTFHRELLINGGEKYYDITLFPLVTNGTEGIAIRADDITEVDKKEQQLRQSQKMELVGTLAGGLAHDFNNVLGGIIGTLSLIKFKMQKEHYVKEEELKVYLDTMEKAGQRATDMVQQLLAVSRKQELSFAPTDLNLTIRHVMEICENSFDKSIELKPSYLEERAVVNADSTQIEQVLLNLCVNAYHAMSIMREEGERWGGRLTVSLEEITAGKRFCAIHPEAEKINYWMLSVGDTGVGMNPPQIDKIFDPFFTTKEGREGTGLGLAMVYNIVRQHKGFIDVYSEEGTGTTFNVYLPVLEKADMPEEKFEEDKIPKGEGLILVVDDEEIMRQTAKAVLEECGYEVILAKDGEEGVKVFKERNGEIQAVLLDMVMPKMSGKETFIEMKEFDPDLKVLLTSGFKQDERVEDVLKLGVNDFIQKPYTLEKLARKIKEIV